MTELLDAKEAVVDIYCKQLLQGYEIAKQLFLWEKVSKCILSTKKSAKILLKKRINPLLSVDIWVLFSP